MKEIQLTLFLSLLMLTGFSQSSWYVSENGSDISGNGSEAQPWATITNAMSENSVVNGDTIYISGVITQDGGGEMGIQMQKSLILKGESKETSVLQAAESKSFAEGRVLTIWDVAEVVLINLTIRNGNFAEGTFHSGAGILNWGNLIIENCIITNNYCENEYLGGGIYNYFGNLSINNTYVYSNFSSFGGAGILSEGGSLFIDNTSVALNFTQGNLAIGGGILITGEAEASIINSTIYYNLMGLNSFGGGLYILASEGNMDIEIVNTTIADNEVGEGGFGKGIFLDDNTPFEVSLTIKNTIIANSNENNYGQSSSGPINLSRSYTLCQDATFPQGEINGNANSVDPQIESFMNHGGETPTCLIGQNSPAVNAGTGEGVPETDQRGFPRSGNTDIGSFEYQYNTGLQIFSRKLEIVAFPNPASELVTFQIPDNSQATTIHILDISGKLIDEIDIGEEQVRVNWNCSSIIPGLYFYRAKMRGEEYRGHIIVH